MPSYVHLKISILFFVLFCTVLTTPSHAQIDDEERVLSAVVERVSKSYGGKAMRSLRTVTIKSDRRLAWPGQGQTSLFVEHATDINHKHFDLKNQQGSVERWIHQNGNIYHNRYIVTKDGGATIDYFQSSIERNPDENYLESFHSDYRISDILLAHLLVTKPPEMTYKDEGRYGEHIHDIIQFSITPDSPKLDVYVSKTDGLIRRISYARESDNVNIIFSNHTRKKGLAYARDQQVYLGDTLVEYESNLTLIPNARVAKRIVIEGGLTPPKEPIDMTKMSVDEISPQAYVAGQGDYSLFVPYENGLIAVNAYGGLKARYDAVTKSIGKNLPLIGAIITHHHSDHMDGVSDALDLGAKLYVTEETKRALLNSDNNVDDSRIHVMQDESSIGPLTVYIRGTSHVTQNAFIFHKTSGALFQDDHYHGLLKNGPSRIQPTARVLYDFISESRLPVKYLLSGHARKAEEWDVFDQAVRNYSQSICPKKRAICEGRSLSGIYP